MEVWRPRLQRGLGQRPNYGSTCQSSGVWNYTQVVFISAMQLFIVSMKLGS